MGRALAVTTLGNSRRHNNRLGWMVMVDEVGTQLVMEGGL